MKLLPFLLPLNLLWAPVLCGHEVDQHFLRITLYDDHFTGRLEMDAGYALPELRSPSDETVPTLTWLDALPESERERIKVQGAAYLHSVMQFRLGGENLTLNLSFGKWGTDWPMFFDQRPDTFARMVWDVRADYGEKAGDLELFWNESDDGPSLALQTVSGERELELLTVSQGEEHTIAFVANPNSPTQSRENGENSSRRNLVLGSVVALLIGAFCLKRFLPKKP